MRILAFTAAAVFLAGALMDNYQGDAEAKVTVKPPSNSQITYRTTASQSYESELTLDHAPYNRNGWGGWLDRDQDGQNTRHEILIARSQETVTFRSPRHRYVDTGLWYDFFTASWKRKSSQLDMDHIVPLSWAHKHGGWKWEEKKRLAFSNDPENLMPVDSGENRSKSDSGPDEWLPPNQDFTCDYVERWQYLLSKYSLSFSETEQHRLQSEASQCF